jgi:hypothetical protein
MRALSIATRPRDADLGELVLRGLVELGPPPPVAQTELCLELGLSFWIRRSGVSLEEAVAEMMAMRLALVESSGIDLATEPVPFGGADTRLAVLNLATYLRGLLGRAAAADPEDVGLIVERALLNLERRARAKSPLGALG